MMKSQALLEAQQEMKSRVSAVRAGYRTPAALLRQDRNQDIADEHAEGKSVVELANEHCLTRARVYAILAKTPASEDARKRAEKNLEREITAAELKQHRITSVLKRLAVNGITIQDLQEAQEAAA